MIRIIGVLVLAAAAGFALIVATVLLRLAAGTAPGRWVVRHADHALGLLGTAVIEAYRLARDVLHLLLRPVRRKWKPHRRAGPRIEHARLRWAHRKRWRQITKRNPDLVTLTENITGGQR